MTRPYWTLNGWNNKTSHTRGSVCHPFTWHVVELVAGWITLQWFNYRLHCMSLYYNYYLHAIFRSRVDLADRSVHFILLFDLWPWMWSHIRPDLFIDSFIQSGIQTTELNYVTKRGVIVGVRASVQLRCALFMVLKVKRVSQSQMDVLVCTWPWITELMGLNSKKTLQGVRYYCLVEISVLECSDYHF